MGTFFFTFNNTLSSLGCGSFGGAITRHDDAVQRGNLLVFTKISYQCTRLLTGTNLLYLPVRQTHVRCIPDSVSLPSFVGMNRPPLSQLLSLQLRILGQQQPPVFVSALFSLSPASLLLSLHFMEINILHFSYILYYKNLNLFQLFAKETFLVFIQFNFMY